MFFSLLCNDKEQQHSDQQQHRSETFLKHFGKIQQQTRRSNNANDHTTTTNTWLSPEQLLHVN